MKCILLSVLFVSLAVPAYAVGLVCTVPAASVARAVELCEELRLRLSVRTADWDNDVCASEFLRIGLKEGERRSTARATRATVSQAVSDAIDTFNTNWPQLTPAQCGDTVLDTEFGEQCDPPDGGVTCDDNCQTVP